MSFLDTKHKRKSFTLTSILYALLLVILFFAGLNYLDPPPESGIAINFGTSDVGSGNIQPQTAVQSAPRNTTPEPQVEKTSEVKEEVVTQEVEEAPVIKNEPKKEVKKTVTEQPKKATTKPVEAKKPDPKPDKSTTDALSSILNGPKSNGTATGDEGNDNQAGDKGDPNGDPNASSYYGNGKGLDGDGNYQLGGRKALSKPKRVQDCNEAGIVVVSIEVDRNGNVIKATPGVRGTTNNSRCLLDPAKAAALATKFNPDTDAPSRQIGKIVYKFSLSE
ncbi:outer membrane transport energization protein TonB [Leeuwenhoekiella aestuarii]|uniref:Outer membrane transport energization protein TonB n=1 Tax=Leeuwenhoekiella aestuarii TaxID=2249426 RepID=A0A4V1KP69_9FLAO|nr:energy transducer TonB [Leeuwenhoekiella aestuarii]RXG14037.1 outer membrane transport energization protein TonB [Leeuwenhoekiella aestuarii]RXG18786.1 outer membrane transport energization protein TonB [Leeuwenhoekiella aestuarii]